MYIIKQTETFLNFLFISISVYFKINYSIIINFITKSHKGKIITYIFYFINKKYSDTFIGLGNGITHVSNLYFVTD